MTRNHAKEPYALSGLARVHNAVAKQTPLDWARAIHTLKTAGEMRHRKEVGDTEKTTAKVRQTMKAELVETALKTILRGENELRVRALIRATRLLAESKDPKDGKMAKDLSSFLTSVWGVTRAYEAVAEGDAELHDRLRDEWGDVQLPPPAATVNLYAADELLIQAVVRRLG